MKIKINEFLFSVAYYPWIFSWMFTSTYLKDVFHPYGIINIWEYIGVLCIILKFCFRKKVDLKSLVLIPTAIIISFFVSKDNGNASFVFYSFLLIFAAVDLDFDRIVKWSMYLQIISLVLTVSMSLLHMIPNDLFVSSAGGFLRNRYSLGYTFPTFVPNYFCSIVIEYVYLRFRKVSWLEVLLIFVFNIYIYQQTGTRLTFILVFMIIVFERVLRNYSNIFVKSVPYSFILLSVITYLATVLYSPTNTIFVKLNFILSQRLRFAQQGLQNWGISLFGTSITWNSDATNYNYVDFSYINMLVSYGIIVFLIVIIGYTIYGFIIKKSNNEALTLVLWIWAIRASVDPQLFLLWFNPFLILVGMGLLYNRKGKNAINYMCT
ncbi:hypothetical protein [Streptococcus suis]|uniref:hypothetical protein n=1 Tax=Streptococcus suis TaxID=1307 RepID=UPI000CF6CE84|nr:hypothetical protein [Streptococcus suis]